MNILSVIAVCVSLCTHAYPFCVAAHSFFFPPIGDLNLQILFYPQLIVHKSRPTRYTSDRPVKVLLMTRKAVVNRDRLRNALFIHLTVPAQ